MVKYDVKITWECLDCGSIYEECFDNDYFEDEQDIENLVETGDGFECENCGSENFKIIDWEYIK